MCLDVVVVRKKESSNGGCTIVTDSATPVRGLQVVLAQSLRQRPIRITAFADAAPIERIMDSMAHPVQLQCAQ